MNSVVSSQSVILTTAMAVSGAVLLLSLSRIWDFPATHQNSDSDSQSSSHISSYPLRSCLSSDGTRRDKKKKRVKFADNVKDQRREVVSDHNGKKINKEQSFMRNDEIPELRKMPANRVALYHGILRDRVQRIQYSY